MKTLVSFSGIDGAGKSTQIAALLVYLQQTGVDHKLYTFWDDIVTFRGFRDRMSRAVFKGDQGVGSPNKPISRKDKNVAAWYMTPVRMFFYAADALSLRFAVTRARRNSRLIIFDRYIYDELANLPLQSPAVRMFVRFILWQVPKPSLSLLLDADPESATIRKPEYPLQFVRKNRDAYLELSGIAGMTIVPPGDVQETAAMIRDLALRDLLELSYA